MNKYTLERQETVLLIIDIQEKLLPAMKYGEQIIQRTNILSVISSDLNIPIIVTEQNPKGLGPTVNKFTDKLKDVQKFEKMSFSACTEQVTTAFSNIGRKKVIVKGMEAHIYVFKRCNMFPH